MELARTDIIGSRLHSLLSGKNFCVIVSGRERLREGQTELFMNHSLFLRGWWNIQATYDKKVGATAIDHESMLYLLQAGSQNRHLEPGCRNQSSPLTLMVPSDIIRTHSSVPTDVLLPEIPKIPRGGEHKRLSTPPTPPPRSSLGCGHSQSLDVSLCHQKAWALGMTLCLLCPECPHLS